MAYRSTASRRIALMGLAVAGALAGSAGSAAAQYYYDDYPPYPAPYAAPYYGYRYAPPIAAPVTRRDIRRMASEEYGFVQIDRLSRNNDTYVIDGVRANGRHERIILDAFAGSLIRRIPLRTSWLPPGREIARVDPREESELPRPRIAPKPPQRPAELKPPAQASAPATAVPDAPAVPAESQAPAPEPETQAPVEANAEPAEPAPAATVPASPSPVEADKAADKPKLVNPEDVRGIDEAERLPPLTAMTGSPAKPAEAAGTAKPSDSPQPKAAAEIEFPPFAPTE